MSSFGEELQRLMKEKALTQEQIAERVGTKQSFISKLIRGERKGVGADVLYKLCDALSVSCDHFRPFLAGETDEPEPPAKAEKKPKGKK